MANANVENFRKQYNDVAVAAGRSLGVSPDVLLSQWGLETGWGKSVIPGTNNLGNIKDFSGNGVAATDNMTGSKDKYRAYATPADFASDYVALIKRKYPAAVGANDPVAFATALKAGGYAEDPKYVDSIAKTYNTLTGQSVSAPEAVTTPVPAAPQPRQAATPGDMVASLTQVAPDRLAAQPADMVASLTELAPDANAVPKVGKEYLTPYEKTVVLQAQGSAARAGYTTPEIVAVGQATKANMPNVVVASINNDAATSRVDSSTDVTGVVLANATQAAQASEAEAQKAGFWDKAKATVHMGGMSSPTQALFDYLHLQSLPSDVVPFDFRKDWESNLGGYSAAEQEYIISNGQGSQQAWTDAQQIVERRRAASQVVAGGNQVTSFAAQALVGTLDPVSLVAFGGVGKVAQLAGVSARGFAEAGRTYAAVAATGAENAVGGLLVDATLAATGNHVSLEDVTKATGLNFMVGAGFGLMHVPKARQAAAMQGLRDAADQAAAREVARWQTVQQNIGPNATPAQLSEEFDRLAVKEMNDISDIAFAPVPATRRLLDDATLAGTAASLSPEAITARELKYGTTNIADPAERVLATAYRAQAEEVLRANAIDPSRHSKLLSWVGLQDTSQTLLQSADPLAQAFAIIATESASGAAARGQTAAMARHINHKAFMGDFNTRYENAYHLWSRENGGTWIGDHSHGNHYARFNRMVAEQIENFNTNVGPTAAAHPAVEAAARAQLEGMDRMRRAMQQVGTTGAARLGDSSFGYMTRTINSAAVRDMSPAKRSAVVSIYADQFQTLSGWDREFSIEHARRILEMADTRAMGGVDMPLSIHDDRMAGIVEDALMAANLPPERVNELLGRFSRGGANFTKGRTELSLNTAYDIDGEAFTLMDLIDTDLPKLYRRYANRAAGEVALTQHGIQGKAGLDTLRATLAAGGKMTPAEMEAFDQIAAEHLGVPFGTRNRAIDAAASMTTLVRLGGIGFTQMGETFNAIHVVGVERTLRAIPEMARCLREVHQLAAGGQPKNRILGTIEINGAELGTEHYRKPIAFAESDIISKTRGAESYSVAERALRAGQNVQATLSMHAAVTTAQIRAMSEQIVDKAMVFIKNGKELDAALKDIGLTEQTAAALRKDLPKMAKFSSDGRLTDLDLTQATDKVAAKEFIHAVHRGASQIIQGTFIGETGKWAHSSLLRALLQYRTFGVISVAKQFNRQLGVHGAAKAFGFMLGSMSFAIPIHAARVHLATVGMSRSKAEEYKEKQLAPNVLARAAMNYTSFLGLAPDMADALMMPLGIQSSNQRGASGKGIADIVPVLGMANDTLKLGRAVLSHSPLNEGRAESVPQALKRTTPFGRLPQVIPFMNVFGEDE